MVAAAEGRMTVIVGAVGPGRITMAADTQVSGATVRMDATKLIRRDGAVLGIAGTGLWATAVGTYHGPLGSRENVQDFALWWHEWGRSKGLVDCAGRLDGDVLIATESGLYEICGDGAVYPVAKYAAVGSGEGVAMGALWAGRNAQSAVRAAIAHSPGCGGEVHVETVKRA